MVLGSCAYTSVDDFAVISGSGLSLGKPYMGLQSDWLDLGLGFNPRGPGGGTRVLATMFKLKPKAQESLVCTIDPRVDA